MANDNRIFVNESPHIEIPYIHHMIPQILKTELHVTNNWIFPILKEKSCLNARKIDEIPEPLFTKKKLKIPKQKVSMLKNGSKFILTHIRIQFRKFIESKIAGGDPKFTVFDKLLEGLESEQITEHNHKNILQPKKKLMKLFCDSETECLFDLNINDSNSIRAEFFDHLIKNIDNIKAIFLQSSAKNAEKYYDYLAKELEKQWKLRKSKLMKTGIKVNLPEDPKATKK